MVERVGNLGESERCGRCGGENVSWHTPSPLWNFVMRSNRIDGPRIWNDLVCIPCFVVVAEEAGVKPPSWRLTAVPEPEGLNYTTSEGWVWNHETCLWDKPQTTNVEDDL